MSKPKKPSRRSDKGRKKKRPKKATVLIPLTFNDGSQVPVSILQSIHDEIFVAFDGWIINGTVKGAYRMRSGEKRTEDLENISIYLDARQVPQLERMVAKWASILGQETMLLEIADYIVKFVPPSEC